MKNILIIIITAIVFQGCATIFTGTKSHVKVDGMPENAKVYLNGNFIGNAPTKVKVSKKALKDNSIITVKSKGYETATIKVVRKTKTGALIFDVIFMFVGLPIDFATGAIYKPFPKEVNYNLDKN